VPFQGKCYFSDVYATDPLVCIKALLAEAGLSWPTTFTLGEDSKSNAALRL